MTNVTNEMILQAIKELALDLKDHKEETRQKFEQIDNRLDHMNTEIKTMHNEMQKLATSQKLFLKETWENKTDIQTLKDKLEIL